MLAIELAIRLKLEGFFGKGAESKAPQDLPLYVCKPDTPKFVLHRLSYRIYAGCKYSCLTSLQIDQRILMYQLT